MPSRTRACLLAVCSLFALLSHSAFAATVPPGACLYALDSTASRAFQIAGAQSVYTACGVVSESSASDAFEMEGSETLYLQDHAQVSVVGSAQLNGQKLWDTINNAQTQAVKATSPGDPFASLSAPTSGTIVSTSHASYDMNNKPHNNTLSPGVYCGGLTIGNTNGATFTFSPGVYVMAGGGLTLNSQAVVAGSGVTFYTTSSTGWGCSSSSSYSPLTISGQVTANLSAPTSGTYDGILFFGNRTGCSTAGSCQDQINGGSNTVLNGALYFKSDQIVITGSNASGYTMLVADKIYINGNSTFATNGSPFDGITVSVSPSSASLNPGRTQQFTATVANSSNPAVNWTISPSVGSINSSGLYTAPATITTQQTVTVTATSQDDSAKHGTATIALYPPVSVAVTPASATVYQGQTQQLAATVTNNANTAVTWSISPAVGTISASGLYTAPASVTTSQMVSVTATSAADPTKSASAAITLSPPIAVSVSPTSATLYASQTQQLTATVTNTTNTAVTWSILPAGVGTVTTGGLYTAPSTISAQQTITVKATSVANPSAAASTTITLEPPVAVSGVSPSSAALYAGQTQTFSATVINTSNTAVTWSIFPSSAGSISSSGVYTAPSSIPSQQTVTVTATSQASSTATATATITLYPPVAVSVTPTSSTLYGGGTQQFSAAVSNTMNTAVAWTLSGAGSISSSGLYTAPATVTTQQTVTVTATSQANSSVSAMATVTLYPPIAVSVTPMTSADYANGTIQLSATVSNTSNLGVTWTLSGPGSISSSGLYTAPASVTSQQSVTITATSQANSSVSSSVTITLYPPVAVAVSPATATLYANGTQQFAATVSNTTNTAVTWSISGPGSIDTTGLYAAPNSIATQQTVTVTATSQANSAATATASITLYPPISVSVTPTTANVYANGTVQLSAAVSNAANTAVTWSLSGSGSISSSGLYTAPASVTSQQTITITVTSQANPSVSSSVTFTLYPPITLAVSPTTATVSANGTQQFSAAVSNTTNTAATWTISPSGVGTIDSTGLYTAPSSISSPQTVTVTATSVADPTKSASATVTLSAAQCATSPYSHRRIITIDHTKVPNTDQTDFPMLVSGTYPFLGGVANGGQVQNANGYDIIFTSDPQGQVPLDFEIDSYNATTGAAAFWVRIPTLSHTADTAIYMWYGNAAINSSQENKAGVWRNNFLSVYHLGDGSNVGVADSGSAGYALSGSATAVPGVIGGGAGFNGSSQLVHENVTAYPTGSSAVTIEGWVNITPNTTGGDIFGYGANSANGSRVAFGTSSSSLVLEFENIGLGGALPTLGNWHHIVGVYGGGLLANVYVDGGQLAETNDLVTPAITTDEFKIGGIPTVWSCCFFTGSADEVRVSSGTRSADWVATEYNSESSPSTFYSLSGQDAVAINPASITLYGGQSVQLSAAPLNACVPVNWSVAPSGVGTITSSGLYTAPSTLATPQVVTVTATTTSGPVQSGTATISLAPPVTVTVTPASTTIVDGSQPVQLTATVANTSNTAVTWSISPSAVGSLTASGLYTAPQTLPANQTLTVTATSVANSSVSASATIMLNPAVSTAVPSPVTCAATGYTAQRVIVIDHTRVPNTDQVNFPFLFSSTDPAFATTANGGKMMSYTGNDILFTLDPNGTEKLDYEIQSYDPVHGQITAWVRIPTLSHTSDTVIYLFYGNPGVTGSQANPAGVWDTNYQAVYHFANSSSTSILDSTIKGNNAVPSSLTFTQGVLGTAAAFDGSSSYVHLPAADFIGYPTSADPGYTPYSATFQTWFKTTANNGLVLEQDNGSGTPGGGLPNGSVPAFVINPSGALTFNFFGNSHFAVAPISTSTAYNDNQWHLATIVANSQAGDLYMDGQFVGSSNFGYPWGGQGNWAASYNYYLGTGSTGAWNFFNGDLDEVEISTTSRSSDWIAAQYNNQSSPSTFYKLYAAYPGAISLSPPSVSLYGGQRQQFVASTTGSCVAQAVVWSGNAGMPGTLTADGLYLAPASIDTQRTVTLTATTLGDASGTVSATVTLLPPVSVSVTPPFGTLAAGQTQQLVANVANATNPGVTWKVSPAGGGSVSANGLYAAPATISAAEIVNVTATSIADPSQSATATLTLTPPIVVLPVTVAVNPASATVYARQSQQLTATVANTSNTAVTWQISPAGVGTITADGVYTAPSTITTQQTVTITATSQVDPTESGWAILTLSPSSCASSGYSYERTITINHAQVQNTNQTNFPVLISTTDPLLATTANGGHVANASGYDIIFSADPNGVTKLDYELEQYNPVTGQVVAWVRVPTLSHTADTTIYLFYGNSSVTSDQQNASGVWSNGFAGVWHLPNGTTLSANDSTLNGNNGTINGATATAGEIGGAGSFDGATAYIDLGASSNLPSGYSPRTMCTWAKLDALPGGYAWTAAYGTPSGSEAMFLGANGNTLFVGGYGNDVTVPNFWSSGQWNFVCNVYDGATAYAYGNGTLLASAPKSWNLVPAYAYIGKQVNGGEYWPGAIDEVTISSTARTADWISTEYNNESNPSSFYSLGAENDFAISPASISLFGGQSQQFAATRACTSTVAWSMPSGSPGTLSASGLYTAPASVSSPQSITITATGQDSSTAAATVNLLAGITVALNPSSVMLTASQSQQFTATVVNGSHGVVWSISPAGAGTISSSGLYTAPASITGQTVTVTATSADDSTKSTTATITLTATGCVSNGYGYQRTIVIDHTKVPNTDQVNFPFLFNTTDPDLANFANGGHVANANGYDIIFSLDPNGMSKLDHEVEQYNPATGQLAAWVRIPTLQHTADTVIYIFYGNPNITTPQANSTGVWNSDYTAVYHLGGLSSSAPDSTASGNSGTLTSIVPGTGLIDGAATLNGTASYIQIPGTDFPNYPTGQYSNFGTPHTATSTSFAATFGVWFKTTTAGGLLGQGNGSTCVAQIFGVCLIYGPTEPGAYDPAGWDAMLYVDTNGKVESNGITSANAYNDNNWHYAVMTHATDGTRILYVDGQNVGTQEQDFTYGYADSYIYYLGTGYTLLGYGGNWNWLYFDGNLDEVSISDKPRSADWIKTEFNNQSSPSAFYNLSPLGSLVLAPSTATLYAAQTQQFVVGGTCSSAIIWTLSSGSLGTLSSTGLYTAPAIVSASQTVTVTAANATSGTTIGSATITLLPVPSPITLSANAAGPYTVGTSQVFTARMQDQSGTPEAGVAVTFTITGANAAIAKATTDSSGTATYAYTASNSGTDKIQAAAVVNGVAVTSSSLSVTWNLAIAPPVQASVTLLPQPTLGQGGLVGAFTDNAGVVIEPIAIGASRSLLVPAGATQLQLGIDDTYFSDNGGTGYVVNVNGTPVTVTPKTMPWTWVAGGLNGNLQYGFSDGTAPVVAATGLTAGQPVTIAYQSGTVSVGATGRPFANANGDQTQITGTNISTGLYFPTLYTTASAYPIGEPVNWSAVVTDASGQPVANAPVTFSVSGVNQGQYSATTDPTGTATFPYSGTYAGTDTLVAQSGSLSSQTSNLIWQTYPAESTPTSLTISYFTTDVDLQDWILYATDASGNPIANANIGVFVTGVDNFQVAATTDITGHATFSYFHTNPGPYTIVAADSVNDTVVKTAPVSGTWTVPATGISNPAGNQISINISTTTTIALPTNSVTLTTTITDSNGLTPTTSWTQVSGPGTVTFGDPTQASTTATFSRDGVYVLQLSASDTASTVSQQVTITVDPPPVNNYSQGWFASPLYGSQGTGIIPVTLQPGVTLTSGTLVYYSENDIFDVTVLNSNTIGSGQIGTFDTTQLPNGSYVLELYATNSQGVSQYSDVSINVVGGYKPGRVTSTVTDLVVPAKGLAINIQRRYDSLNASQSSDFGYGWSLSTNVGLTVDAHNDVSFTLNGQTHTFFFAPQPFGGGFLQLGTYSVAFTPDSGIHGTLTDNGQGCPLDFVLPDGSLWYCVGGGLYQPSGYIYTDPSGTKYTISANGNLQSIVDIGGNTLTVTANGITSSTGLSVPFVRDAQGRITQITDPKGNKYLYSYDSSGNLAGITYPGVTQAGTYTYTANHLYLSGTDFRNNPLPTTGYFGPADTDVNGLPLNGRLKSVADALGQTTSYAYNLATNATTISYPPDANGHVGTATTVYDGQGNLLSSTDPNGLTTTNIYDATGNLLSVTDPLGKVTSYTYDANGNRTSTTYPATATSTNTTSYTTYNQNSEPTSSTDELGNVRTYNYDANSWPSTVTDSLGTLMSSLFGSDGTMQAGAIGYDITTNPARASQFTYDANGNRTSTTDALGRVTLYGYNSLGQKTSSTEPVPYGSNLAPATTAYTYDALGRLTETDAPLGRTTKSTYDANGNKLTDTDANGNVTSYAYDTLNRLQTTTYPDHTTVTNTYDFRGNIVTQTDQAGNVTRNVYDVGGRLISTTKAFGTANATTTSYTYDGDGRKLTQTDGLGHATTWTYDSAGNLTTVSGVQGNFTYGYDNARNRVSTTDALGDTTAYAYDARKRLTQTTYPDSTTVTNTYDGPGNLASVRDQAGKVVSYTYDAANQLATVVQMPNSTPYTTSYSYDLLGNLGTVTDANGHTTTNSYDLLSEINSKKLPDGSLTEGRTYDVAGNLTSLTHFNGVTTTYTYDTLNRLLSRATPGEATVTYTYTATGKRHTMTDASGTTTYSYDSADRLTSKATPAGTLSYTYDAAGNVASIASSNTNGASMSYTWDSLNRLSTVVDSRLPAGHNTTTYPYDPASNLVSVAYPNGLVSTMAYDAVNRMTGLGTVTGSNAPVASYNYAPLGATGIRTQAAEAIATPTSADTRNVNWSYDNTYRLTQEQIANDSTVNGTVSYTLDPVGNRTQETSSITGLPSVSLAFNADDLLTSGESYDADGNTTATGGSSFAYDSQNRLVSMNSGAVTLVYDGDGNRVAKTVSGVTTKYLVDDLNPTGYPQVIEELVGGSVARTYTYGLQRISEDQPISGTWTPSFYGYDGGGTVRQLTNSAGTVTDSYNYDAFGNKLNSTGSTPNEFLYRGEQYDLDLGLYYLRARYYNPATGRFMSRDPEGGKAKDPASLHKYLYAGGDPVNAMDPTGRSLFDTTTLSFKILTAAVGVAFVGASIVEVLDCIGEAVASALPQSTPSVGPAPSGPCELQHDEWPPLPEGPPLGSPRWAGVGDTGESN